MTPEERKKETKRITLSRGRVMDKGVCSLCGDEEKKGILKNDILSVELIANDGVIEEWILCNFHEGVLMMKLLHSYMRKRACSPKSRERKMGFKEGIPLPPREEKVDGAEPSAEEKLKGVVH